MPARASRPAPGLPARAGLGFKPEHYATLVEQPPDLGFFEIHAENYMVPGGPAHAQLAWLRERYAISVHGVGLSLGGHDPLDARLLAGHRQLQRRYAPDSISEHLAWSRHDGRYFNDLLPIVYDDAALRRVCAHIDQFQQCLGQPILLENPATYVRFEASHIDEAQFLCELVARTGCGLLLDVNNVYVSAVNHGFDARAYLARLPLAAVGEIHLAGHARQRDAHGRAVLIDSHDAPVDEAVWDLYEYTLALTGPVATLLERDGNIPPLAGLLAETGRVTACLARGLALAA
ncbi:Protein of uncharacterised function (DUF692) [Bordetella pertussis]|uniref:UPF0276 protein BP2925 n=3 Tax=Bordetella pertussis TaxID=520 RepID=Y2925_BORPE|nr:DUF692 domain-containing protein [Bordetella pertussis]Q7VUZ0.2 RecName: Full=UPF0276 protein BP2925 [Bordetella pertussis Tohama I]ETH40123.1 PF05114 family protein [Bordetella pertussis H918]ETH43473.1 PF05114 family protein [Bordetella pertussis H939]ETH47472.1 PF05114 family protein [Bordetella pertussis H921]ETH72169.1 PF05114 family protein [Bordetella pertussis STO1-CHLA-0011]ETH83356.1 PF05114 family protein [Bordetella pertussis STO1-CHOC-0017]ETH85889.1 PF05114 family protein [B